MNGLSYLLAYVNTASASLRVSLSRQYMRILYALVAEEHYHGVKDKDKIMKANTPEKLYVDTEDGLSDSILYGFTEKRKEDDIEYIRADAFIEKACKYLEPNVKIILCGDKIDTDKFIEDFRKYMKGE
jgi:hypothetical protein